MLHKPYFINSSYYTDSLSSLKTLPKILSCPYTRFLFPLGVISLGRVAQDPNIHVHKSTLSQMVSRSKLLTYRKKKAASTNRRTQDATDSLGKTTHELEASIV